MIRKVLAIFFLCCVALVVQAQPDTDEQLAKQFFDNREFDKSAILYEKLFDKAPLQEYFEGYLESVLAQNDFKTAEKFIKKQIKRNPGNHTLAVHLGYVYKLSGADDKSKKQFNEAVDKLEPNQQAVIALSQAFYKYKEIDFVIKTLAAGKKIMRGVYPFNMELADAYNAKGDYVSMYKEHLEALALNEAYLGQIQNILQNYIGDEFKGAKADELRIQLLKRIQQFPDRSVYAEFLIWFFIQQRDFESAFTQAKALDKRSSQNIGKVLNLAQICVSNQEYDVAIKCFDYEVQKGQSSPYYSYARAELVNTIQKKITETSNADPILLAECKLELGDIYIFTGEMWEPALLYGQVDKGFKHDAIGQEAKFRNARLSFYKGEFEWAQAQLDVLKGATSKLIANDALELSLLISDNTVDSNYVPLAMFSRADLLSFQNKDSIAMLTLDSINKEFPGHSLSDDILYKKYKIDFKAGKFQLASEKLDQIILNYSDDILGDDAVFKLAELCEKKLIDLEKAKKLYQDVLLNYPGSLYAVEARKRYRKMRGDGLN